MSIDSPFHEGELAVQALADEQDNAARNGRAIGDAIMPGALKFLVSQPMLVMASVDDEGRVWSSLLTGRRGFATAPDQHTVQLDLSDAGSHDRDPLWENIASDPRAGVLSIDLAHRRRLRINGRISATGPHTYRIDVAEAFPNCPKYIQRRHFDDPRPGPGDEASESTDAILGTGGPALTAGQRRWIESADTLFVASLHPERGADASHRGGAPGFVRLLDDRTLRVPDYAGNSMFNTLGNLQVNPRAGVLFFDFERARTLQLTGKTTLHFGAANDADGTGGTGRSWDLAIDRWIETPMTHPLHAEFLDAWPQNPAA